MSDKNIVEWKSFLMRHSNHDKVYHIWIEEVGTTGTYIVKFRFGRREWGFDNLNAGVKSGPVYLADAQKIFNKMVREKDRKGYTMFNNTEEMEVFNALAF
jgi:hypothetical protein